MGGEPNLIFNSSNTYHSFNCIQTLQYFSSNFSTITWYLRTLWQICSHSWVILVIFGHPVCFLAMGIFWLLEFSNYLVRIPCERFCDPNNLFQFPQIYTYLNWTAHCFVWLKEKLVSNTNRAPLLLFLILKCHEYKYPPHYLEKFLCISFQIAKEYIWLRKGVWEICAIRTECQMWSLWHIDRPRIIDLRLFKLWCWIKKKKLFGIPQKTKQIQVNGWVHT